MDIQLPVMETEPVPYPCPAPKRAWAKPASGTALTADKHRSLIGFRALT
jgi:hypothetical protein